MGWVFSPTCFRIPVSVEKEQFQLLDCNTAACCQTRAVILSQCCWNLINVSQSKIVHNSKILFWWTFLPIGTECLSIATFKKPCNPRVSIPANFVYSIPLSVYSMYVCYLYTLSRSGLSRENCSDFRWETTLGKTKVGKKTFWNMFIFFVPILFFGTVFFQFLLQTQA